MTTPEQQPNWRDQIHNPERDGRYEDPNTTEVQVTDDRIAVREDDGHVYFVKVDPDTGLTK